MSPGSDAFAYLRKESLDIYNRIRSIAEDIHFVERVHEVYPNLPILRGLFRLLVLHTDFGVQPTSDVAHGIQTQKS